VLDPPHDLLQAIFPWIEEEQMALKQRRADRGKPADDPTLSKFLDLLSRFRRIILQDAAILSAKYPTCPLFTNYAPFNTPQFSTFSSTSVDIIKHAEENARHRLSEIPEVIAGSLRGIVTSNNLQNEQARGDMRERNNRLESRFDALEGLVKAALFGSKANKRRLAASVSDMGESSELYTLSTA
jgi:Centromere DNA-binding protein complex CBF3 subunit, domain 2